MNKRLKDIFEAHKYLNKIKKHNLIKYNPETNVIYDGSGINDLSYYVDLDKVNKDNAKEVNQGLATYNWFTLAHCIQYNFFLKLLGNI